MNNIKPATPLPWHVAHDEEQRNPYWFNSRIYSSSAGVLEMSLHNRHSQGVTNATYIVAACNAFPRLMAERKELMMALHHAVEACEPEWLGDDEPCWMVKARALLARIGEG